MKLLCLLWKLTADFRRREGQLCDTMTGKSLIVVGIAIIENIQSVVS